MTAIGEPIAFFEDEYKFLSNFARTPVTWTHPADTMALSWPTVEHAYQAAKTTDLTRAEEIRQASGPGQAKRMGNDRQATHIRSDWEEGYKFVVMLELLRIKFSDPELRKGLLATGQRPLIEGNSWCDNIFGVCVCDDCLDRGAPALNMLGKLLERVRAEVGGT